MVVWLKPCKSRSPPGALYPKTLVRQSGGFALCHLRAGDLLQGVRCADQVTAFSRHAGAVTARGLAPNPQSKDRGFFYEACVDLALSIPRGDAAVPSTALRRWAAVAMPPPLIDRRRVPRPAETWLPDMCSWPVALSMVGLAQLALLIVFLSPATVAADSSAWGIGIATLLTQWLCLSCVGALCVARSRLASMPITLSASLGLVLVAVVATVGASIAHWLDQTLALNAIPSGMAPLPFAASVAAIACLVAAVAFRYFYVSALWRQGVAAQALAQLEALQARIRPHFLFNSMNTIASLIRTRPADAEQAVENLSDLFRAALRDGAQEGTVADELELVDRYLAIEQLRFGQRLRIRREIVLPLPELQMPALLLQPLVENAVLHGIARIPEGGELHIAVLLGDQQLHIAITNPTPPTAGPHRGTGTALDNVRRRLRLHYGGRASMEVEAAEGYYSVRLHLPLT